MRSFDEIYDIAERRHGPQALAERLSTPLAADDIAKIPEDRWLAQFTRGVFQAGFNWKVIEAKWDGFEAAFHGFDIGRCAMMDDAWFDALVSDTRIVRNAPKIATVRDNAVFVQSFRVEGGIGRVIADWPTTDHIGLLARMKQDGSRLGAMTGQYALRFLGKDSFILSRDVTGRLIAEGVIDKPAASKSSMRAVQEAFNIWMAQSRRGLTQISQVLAMSI